MEIELVKVKYGDFELGKPLPFSVYTQEQLLLLKKHTIVTTLHQFDILLERGLYRNLTEQEILAREALKDQHKKLETDPFACIHFCATKLTTILHEISKQNSVDATLEIQKLAKLLHIVVTLDPNAALGAIHLLHDSTSYSITHAIYTSIVSGLLGRRRNVSDAENQVIICAALTMNISIVQLQDLLYEQATPLTDKQRLQIDNHPEQSTSLLKQAGVTSEVWLEMITQHHEKNDGCGYPHHLAGDSICEGSKIIALADIYTSLITGRKHRPPIIAHEAIKTLFAKRGGEIDEQLANQFIREIGAYPPGTFIKLENGDIAIITKRAVMKNNKTSGPYALSLVSPRGAQYQQPHLRDCSIDLFKIHNALAVSPDNVTINIEELWGYHGSSHKT